MHLAKTEDVRMLESAAARFLADRYPRRGAPPADLWRNLADMGWLALPIDPAHGGLGADTMMLAALLEQFGRANLREPYIPTVVMGAGLLSRFDSEAASALLSEVATGGCLLAVAHHPSLTADRTPQGWTLNGTAPLVSGADTATTLLIAARGEANALALFACPADAPSLEVAPVRTIGGCGAADLTLRTVALGPDALLAQEGVAEALEWMTDRTAALLCADALGAIDALVAATIAYTGTRTQFGRPLRAFQVVEHAIADMLIRLDEARAATLLALTAIDQPPAIRLRAISAAKLKVGVEGRRVAHDAIQFHGAIGLTEELDLGLFVKRLLAIEAQCGTPDEHASRYLRHARAEQWAGHYLASDQAPAAGPEPMPNLLLSASQQRFRDQVVAFLQTNLPPALARAQRLTPTVYPEAEIARDWHRILHAQGWSAPNWPAEFGGPGWDAAQRYIWAQESGLRHAPIISPIGLPLVGPVLFAFGTPEQQQRYLPPILSGEELWCQGFSEPGAGSDLAALATRAVRVGDSYRVTGTKIWTTHGHTADFMAALVRTGPPEGRRQGISFLLIDMHAPGVQVRPIITLGGDHEVNQIFLDDVMVPAANLVGAEGQGWEIGKYLLEYERGGDIMSAGQRALLRDIQHLAEQRDLQSAGFWRAFTEAAADLDVLEMMELRVLLAPADASPAAASILKLRASQSQQAITELGARALGTDLLRGPLPSPANEAPPPSAMLARYLNSRANSIFGGAREIQKTIIFRTWLQI
jgi:alkylation response protein AidB-like acyl-CoA dehydrogenase